MQFKVPQFLDIEDKIFGPFTFSEFAYLVGSGGICYILYKLMGLFYGFLPIAIVASFGVALVWYKPNGKPFINMLEAGFKYLFQDKLYIWKLNKDKKADMQKKNINTISNTNRNHKLTGSKLRDLAWSLDVLDLQKEQK